jgi:uncharacterized low-complexity protein
VIYSIDYTNTQHNIIIISVQQNLKEEDMKNIFLGSLFVVSLSLMAATTGCTASDSGVSNTVEKSAKCGEGKSKSKSKCGDGKSKATKKCGDTKEKKAVSKCGTGKCGSDK